MLFRSKDFYGIELRTVTGERGCDDGVFVLVCEVVVLDLDFGLQERVFGGRWRCWAWEVGLDWDGCGCGWK